MNDFPCAPPPFLLPPDAGARQVCAALGLGETSCARLELYVEELRRWNARMNLVAPDSLRQVWVRHVADGAQLARLWPRGVRHVVDLGAGAGVPGLVLALAMNDSHAEESAPRFTLVESNARKCAFLRHVAQKARIRVRILHARIESLAPARLDAGRELLITARALAPLPRLLELSAPLLRAGARALLHKGAGAGAEMEDSRKAGWRLDAVAHPSITDRRGCIVEIAAAWRHGEKQA